MLSYPQQGTCLEFWHSQLIQHTSLFTGASFRLVVDTNGFVGNN